AYGIRIENLVLVTEAPAAPGGEKPLNQFETLTLAPIDRRAIDTSLLTHEEIVWLDIYHARVAETLAPLVDDATRPWLKQATQSLAKKSAADKLDPAVLGQPLHGEFLGVVEFGACPRSRHHIVGLLRYRTRDLGTEPFSHGFRLIARHFF